MVRKLYIHVGPPKTGTTTIQAALAKYDNSVVLYPKVGLAGTGGHHNLIWNFHGRDWQQQFVRADAKALFSEIGTVAKASTGNVLISSETMFPLGGEPGRTGSDLEAFLAALLPHLGGREMFEVEILVVCREHFERAASYYSNKIRHRLKKAMRIAPDEFLATFAHELCYADQLNQIEALGFRVTTLNYHPRDTWTRRFFQYIGFEEHEFPVTGQGNLSYSPMALIARLAANRVLSTDAEVRAFLAPLRKTPGFRSPSQYIFGKAGAAAANALFDADRIFLRDRYQIRMDPPDLASQRNDFFVDGESFARIGAAAAPFEARGELLLQSVREFLRE